MHVCICVRESVQAQGWPPCTNIGCGVGLRDTRGSGGTWSQPDTLRGQYNRKYQMIERTHIQENYDGEEEEEKRRKKHKRETQTQ